MISVETAWIVAEMDIGTRSQNPAVRNIVVIPFDLRFSRELSSEC